MKNGTIIIEEFMEMSLRCAFSLKDTSYYEGYILEIEDGCVVFTNESPSDPKELLLIPIRKIDLNSLSIWNKENMKLDVYWDEDKSRWNYSSSGKSFERKQLN